MRMRKIVCVVFSVAAYEHFRIVVRQSEAFVAVKQSVRFFIVIRIPVSVVPRKRGARLQAEIQIDIPLLFLSVFRFHFIEHDGVVFRNAYRENYGYTLIFANDFLIIDPHVRFVRLKRQIVVISVSAIYLARIFIFDIYVSYASFYIAPLRIYRHPGKTVAELIALTHRTIVPQIIQPRAARLHVLDYVFFILIVEKSLHMLSPKCFNPLPQPL